MPKILLTGGGTLGSVTPLLAVAAKIKEKAPGAEFAWIGTRYGPEKEVVERVGIKYYKIFSGKLRRYFDWQNFADLVRLPIGFFQSLCLLKKLQPDIIVGVGGFVQVPVVLAGKCLKIPALLHQQDIIPSLSNLILSRFTRIVTVNFEETAKYFLKNKAQALGNPARSGMLAGDHEIARKMFHLEESRPTLVVLGGGTGAVRLNHLIWNALPFLEGKAQIIHSVGKRKLETDRADSLWYHHYEFLGDELVHAYAAATLVISRAGMATLTELSARGMPVILAPISNTHQIDNARYFESRGAALYFDENKSSEELAKLILETLGNKKLLESLSANIRQLYNDNAAETLANLILENIRVDSRAKI